MTIGIKAIDFSDMTSTEFVTGNPWYYTPSPYPFHNPNFYNPPPEYTPPPAPPHVFHPTQPPPPYYTPHTPYTYPHPPPPENTPQTPPLFYYVQPPPLLYTPPFTLTCHTTLSTGQPYYAIETNEDRVEIQKSEVSSASVSEFPPNLTHVFTAHLMFDESSERVRTVESIPVATEEVRSGNDVIIEKELGVEDEGVGDVSVSVLGENIAFKGSGDTSDGGDGDEGFGLFKEAEESIKEVESDGGEKNWSTVEGYELWDWDSEMEEDGVATKKGEVNDVENNDSDDDMCLCGYALKMFDESPELQLDESASHMFDGSPKRVLEVGTQEFDVSVETKYDEDDKEADTIWEKIDNKMDLWMKDMREARLKREIESIRVTQMFNELSLSDVNPLSLGLDSTEWVRIIFSSSNTTITSKKEHLFSINSGNCPGLFVQVFESEGTMTRDVKLVIQSEDLWHMLFQNVKLAMLLLDLLLFWTLMNRGQSGRGSMTVKLFFTIVEEGSNVMVTSIANTPRFLTEDMTTLDKINTIIHGEKEMGLVLCTFWCCVEALQFAEPMKHSQAELCLETYQFLDLEMSRLREVQQEKASAASKLAYDMQQFSRFGKGIICPIVAHLLSIMKLLHTLVEHDHLKQSTSNMHHDFFRYSIQVNIPWKIMECRDIDTTSCLEWKGSISGIVLVLVQSGQNKMFKKGITCALKLDLVVLKNSGFAKHKSVKRDLATLEQMSSGPHELQNMIYSIIIDPVAETAIVQVEVTLGEVYYWIYRSSDTLVFPSGVGSIGCATGLIGEGALYGSAADNVPDARIIEVYENILDRKERGEDLSWAIRGGSCSSFRVFLFWKLNQLVDVPAKPTIFTVFMEEKQTGTRQWRQEVGSIDFVQYKQQTTCSDGFTLDEFKLREFHVLPKVPVAKNMVIAWYWSVITLVFDPGALWLLHSISIWFILEDKDDLKKWGMSQ